ncbi:MAG: nicotinate-nucleotide adenylyltransferase [Fimbriimonadales bacterium]|nr:nicotinate-nucleotide adenylyltransferase [Fimbriimonadales bacterium]
MSGERIGLFGGTFDPVHFGHLRLAEEAREAAMLRRVIFIPAARSPFKPDRPLTDAHHRFEMLLHATYGNLAFGVSDIEIQRGGVSYTIDTVRYFAERMPAARLFLIMGLDSLVEFPQWREPLQIVQHCQLLVGVRPGYEPEPILAALPEAIRAAVRLIPSVPLDISASQLRAFAREGRTLRYLTPDSVIEYIRSHQLYMEV